MESRKVGDVAEVGDVGPMGAEDGAGEGVDFRVGDRSESGSFEAEAESSDAGEPVDMRAIAGAQPFATLRGGTVSEFGV